MTIKYKCGKCLMGFRAEHLDAPEKGEIGRCPTCDLRFRSSLSDPVCVVYVQPEEAARRELRRSECP